MADYSHLDEIVKSINAKIKTSSEIAYLKGAMYALEDSWIDDTQIKMIRDMKPIGRVMFDTKKKFENIEGIGIFQTSVTVELMLKGGIKHAKRISFVGFVTEKDSLYLKIRRPAQAWTRYAREIPTYYEMEENIIDIAENRDKLLWEPHGDMNDERSFALTFCDVPVFVYYKIPTMDTFKEGMRYKVIDAKDTNPHNQKAIYVTTHKMNGNVCLCQCDKYGEVETEYCYIVDNINDMVILKETAIDQKKEKNKRQRID